VLTNVAPGGQDCFVLFEDLQGFELDLKAACISLHCRTMACRLASLRFEDEIQTTAKRLADAVALVEPVRRKRVKVHEDLDGAHVALDAMSKLQKKASTINLMCLCKVALHQIQL